MPSFEKELHIINRYLVFPVKNGSEKVVFQLLLHGKMVREFIIELDRSGSPDWWAKYDVSAFENQILTLKLVNGEISDDDARLIEKSIFISDTPHGESDLYQEALRPQFHFTPQRGWNNDPNGLMFLNGEWHMFFQFNPFGISWGNMHWGHAISKDLVHWQEQPITLFQHSLNDMAFSGGGFIDWPNTSGYGMPGHPPAIIAFTSTGRGECLAFSNDQARTFTEFEENPILTHLGRDPKIFWYAPENKWVMVVFEEVKPYPAPEECLYVIYDSKDLKTWTRRSELPDLWECPELFPLPLNGNSDDVKWVLYGSRRETAKSMCLIGTFDGSTFIPEYENKSSHYGPHFYASQIFSDTLDQRKIMISWLAGASYPEMPFSQGLTIPLELSLRSTPNGPRLCFYPVEELSNLRNAELLRCEAQSIEQANQLLGTFSDELLDLEIEVTASGQLTLDLRGHPLTINPVSGEVTFAGQTGSITTGAHSVRIRVLLDRAITELFINQGEAAFAAMTLPTTSSQVSLLGGGEVKTLKVFALNSIWA